MSTLTGLTSGRACTIAGAGALAFIALAALGCTRGIEAKPVEEVRHPPKDATELLKRVVEVYHQADSYQDQGRLVVQYILEGKTYQETSEFSLAMAGPNRLRLKAYNALAICDGQTFRATIDEAPGEVLNYAAPEELSPAMVYRDPVLGRALNQIAGSVPLSLFLDPEPLPGLLYNVRSLDLDTPEKIGDDLCYRVRIERREGDLVLWIDQKSFVVRRVEYPAEGYRQIAQPDPGVSGMTITAELDGARLNSSIDDSQFHLELPKDAELVKHFDVVMVGARIPKFKMRGLDGTPFTRESLADKVVVVKFWVKEFLDLYRDDLASFEEVRRRYQDQKQDSVVFLTLNADDEDVSDEELKTAWANAKLSMPIVRIDVQVAFRSFGWQGAVPTTVILGRDSSLQEHQLGSYPEQATLLPRKIDTLLTGGELVLEAPQQPPQFDFFAGFAFQMPQGPEEEQKPATRAEFANAEIAPASEPKLLRPTRLWSCTDPTLPGNLLTVTDDSGRDQLLVLHGSSSVAEIGDEGKLLNTHALMPPESDVKVTLLRTAVDGTGNRFYVVFKAGDQQLYVFDANWKRRLVFPQDDEHANIADAQLADLDGDGQLEILVGYVGLVGVHCVGLDGQRIWRNRAAELVLGLGVAAADATGRRQLLVADGGLLPIDAQGNEQSLVLVPDAFLRLISTTDVAGIRSSWCGIGTKTVVPGKPVRDVAIGLSPRGQVKWRYPLPAGTQQHASLQMVATGDLLGRGIGEWVIAAADGSIHILSLDGDVIDKFNFGASLSGMTIARLDGQPALVIATDEGVEAWKFEMPAQASEAAGGSR
jgi:hypothetical protein